MYPSYVDVISGVSGRTRVGMALPSRAPMWPAMPETVVLGAPVSIAVPVSTATWKTEKLVVVSPEEVKAVLAELSNRNVFSESQRAAIEIKTSPSQALIWGVDTGLYWQNIGRAAYDSGTSMRFEGSIRFASPKYIHDRKFVWLVRDCIASARYAVGQGVDTLNAPKWASDHAGALKPFRPGGDTAAVVKPLLGVRT